MDIKPEEEVKVTIEFSEEPEELSLNEFSIFIGSIRYLDDAFRRTEVEQIYRNILYDEGGVETLANKEIRDQFIGQLTQQGVFKRAQISERYNSSVAFSNQYKYNELKITRIQKGSPLLIEFVGIACIVLVIAWLTANIEYETKIVQMKTDDGTEYEERRRHIKFEPSSFSETGMALMEYF